MAPAGLTTAKLNDSRQRPCRLAQAVLYRAEETCQRVLHPLSSTFSIYTARYVDSCGDNAAVESCPAGCAIELRPIPE